MEKMLLSSEWGPVILIIALVVFLIAVAVYRLKCRDVKDAKLCKFAERVHFMTDECLLYNWRKFVDETRGRTKMINIYVSEILEDEVFRRIARFERLIKKLPTEKLTQKRKEYHYRVVDELSGVSTPLEREIYALLNEEYTGRGLSD